MQKTIFYFLVLLGMGLLSCQKSDDETETPVNESNLLLGTWVDIVSHDTWYSVSRAEDLSGETFGFQFSDSGNFVRRDNCGFCGTPPISYCNYEGSWTSLNDSLLAIDVEFWGGRDKYQMKIISVDENTLCYSLIYPEN